MTDSGLSSEYYNKTTRRVTSATIGVIGFFVLGMGLMIFDSIIYKVDVNAVIVGNCTCGKRNYDKRKMYSEESFANWNEFPWHVGILQTLNQRIICGGVLLSDVYVLTSGSCLEIIRNQSIAEREYLVKVVLGEHNVEDNQIEQSQWFWIADFSFHPEYNPSTKMYDLAIIRLSSRAQFTKYVSPICLSKRPNEIYDGRKGIISGFATINPKARNIETRAIQKEVVKIVNYEDCPDIGNAEWNDISICAKGKSCRADSGSPLILKKKGNDWYFLAGLVSFIKEDDCSFIGFTRINSDIVFWIKSAMRGTTMCSNPIDYEIWLKNQPKIEE